MINIFLFYIIHKKIDLYIIYKYIKYILNNMYYYIKDLKNKDNSKLSYILKNNNISYELTDEYIKIIVKKNLIEFTLYHINSQSPQYLISNIENDIDEIRIIYNNINNKIDEYNSLESVILDIYYKFKTLEQEKKSQNEFTNMIKKNLKIFEKELDEKKEKYINENDHTHKSKIFSLRTNLEMLRDQILKLHADPKFNVQIDNFPQIQIILGKFTFINSSNLIVEINMNIKRLNLLLESPKIKITSNKILKDNIIKVITELKPFSDNKFWSVKYSIFETVQNIHNMINTYGEIEYEFSTEFEQTINELEYLVSIKNKNISDVKLLELFDKDLLLKSNDELNKKTSNNKTYWKQGTGYGHDGTTTWDIDNYIKNLNEKKNKILSHYDKLILNLSLKNKDVNEFKNLDKKILNQIILLLINYFQNEEITKSNVSLLDKLIFDNYDVFESAENFNQLLKLIQTYIDENDMMCSLINTKLIETKNSVLLNDLPKTNNDVKKNIFTEMFEQDIFKMYPEEFTKFYYEQTTYMNSDILTRLKKEFNIIKKSIVANQEASIFFWVEKNKLDRMRFIVSGPSNTPYDQGLYIFDMTLSKEYPMKPPLVHFSNNGGVRFNPNLYNCGKVCLSLLGTWRGEKGESWNSTTSTFFQILISIQSQILIDEPYFNEPSYEKNIGRLDGITKSKEYNDDIRQYNLDHAMNGLIEGKTKYPEFENIIKNYFKFKKNKIIEILNKWELDYTDITKKNKFIESKNKFIKLTDDL